MLLSMQALNDYFIVFSQFVQTTFQDYFATLQISISLCNNIMSASNVS